MKKIIDMFSDMLSAPMISIYVSIIFALLTPFQFVQINRFLAMGIGILLLGIVPMLTVYIPYRIGYIKNMNVDEKERRNYVYLLAIISYVISTGVFYYLDSHVMFLISLAYVCVTSVVIIFNQFFKISAHAAGVAGPVTALIYVFGIKMLPLYLLVPTVAYIRWKLKAHTPIELLAGTIVTIIITYLTYFMMW